MRRGRGLSTAGIVLATSVGLLSTSVARADDVADEADLHFTLGNARFQAGDFTGALEHYLASNRLVPNRNVVFNIALSYEQLKDYPKAYRYYLQALEGETDAPTRARIQKALVRLAPNVAVMTVQTDPPGAKVYLDRKDLGERGNSPLRIGLSAGKYKVIAELAGYDDAITEELDAQNGVETSVVLKLNKIVGTVRVLGSATGARVYVDSEESAPVGVVPLDVQLTPGKHTLFLRKDGFQPTQIVVDVPARKLVEVKPQLDVRSGTLLVNADESGAQVTIDGKPHGPTPALLTLPTGVHTVRVSRIGFHTFIETVTVDANEQKRVDAQLVPREQVEAASRLSEAVEDAPASVSIVPLQELRALGLPTVWEAVRGVRGIYLNDDRGYPTIGFRGFGRPGDYGNRVLVLVDGQPMSDNWIWSSYVGNDFRTDLEDVERIEVVRGPGSVLYGTGAFSGVVNVVTRRNAPPGAEFGVGVSGDGFSRTRARANFAFGENAGAWTSFAAGHSQGRDFFFPELATSTPRAVGGHARGVDGFDVMTWTGRVWWKSLTLQWSYNAQTKHLPTGQFGTLLGDGRTRQTDTRAMVEARFEPKLGDRVESLTRAHANYYAFRANFATPPDAGGLLHQIYDGVWTGVEQRIAFLPASALRLTLGGELQLHTKARQLNTNEVDPRPTLDTDNHFTIAAGYAVADVQATPRLKISTAGRLDAYNYGDFHFASLSPRLAIIGKPYERGNTKFLAGKGFRAPSIYELFFNGTGQQTNKDLRPENLYSVELEHSHRFSPTVVGTASTYAYYYQNLIRQVGTGDGKFQYVNTDTPVGAVGVEGELRREWKEGWMYAFSYALQRSQYLASGSFSDVIGFRRNPRMREVSNSPTHVGSFRGAIPILSRALTAMARVSVVSARFDRNDTNGEGAPAQTKAAPAVIVDLVFSGIEPRWGIRYAVGVYNLIGWREYNPVSPEFRQLMVQQAGRTFLATANITF